MAGNIVKMYLFSTLIICISCAYSIPEGNISNGTLPNDCQQYVDSNCNSFKKIIQINITQSNPCVFSCNGNENFSSTKRLFVKQRAFVNSRHVFATIQSQNFIKAYQLPVSFNDAANNFSSLSEVLCPSPGKVFFSITTNSEDPMPLDFNTRPIDFFLPDAGVTVQASPVSPWGKYYKWKDGVDSVFISVTSKTPADTKICAILHLQQAKCPLATTFEEIQGSTGIYQSFRQFGGTTVKKSDFPDGIFIVLLPLPTDKMCFTHSQGDQIVSRRKTVFIQAIEETSAKGSWLPFGLSFGFFSSLIGSWLYLLRRRTFKYFTNLVKSHGPLELVDSDLRQPFSFLRILQVLRSFTNRNQQVVPTQRLEQEYEESIGERTDSDESLIISSVPEQPLQLGEFEMPSAPMNVPITDELNPRVVGWWRNEATYEELLPSTNLSETAFARNILIVAAFSTIPVYSTLKFILEISDHRLDTCYFNRKCMFSVGSIQDFSKVFTNFGYIVVAVALKNFLSYHERLTLASAKVMKNNDIGVCREYSLFNVLVYELTLQAFMSSLFHLCPNDVTIKFDIIFVFALAVTFIGCIWSLRHSDSNQFTYSTFGLIGSALFVAETRNFLPFWLFWLLIAVIQTYLVLSISFLLTKIGTFAFNPTNMVQVYTKWSSVVAEVKKLKLPQNFSRIPTAVRITIAVLVNMVTLFIGVYYDYEIFSYIFTVCMVNVFYYCTHYIFTKRVLHREYGSRIGWASIVAAVILAIPSSVFFNLSRTDYTVSPAESLTHNASCLVSVFSTHDMWHFTSALTIFALFTGMLTLDDDLAVKKSSEITVF